MMLSPGPALPVRSISGGAAVSDVIPIDGDELLAALRRLLLLPELVVLPATLVLPQLPVSAFRSERTQTGRLNCHFISEDITTLSMQVSPQRHG